MTAKPAVSGRHEAPVPHDALSSGPDVPATQSFLDEVRDAVSARTASLVVGVLAIQLAFILSYVGAFHAPRPHHVPIAVVAPAQVSTQLLAGLNGITGAPVRAQAVPSATAAREKVLDGSTSAALIIDAAGTQDTLLVASGGGAAVVTAVEQVTAAFDAAQHRSVHVEDIVPLQSGDARGLTGFYLVVGWLVGGYLVASLLGVAKGSRPATTRRAIIRLPAVFPYAILSGLGGAIIVGPGLNAIAGHCLALWAVGALLVYCAAAVTLAFQVLAGTIGIGLSVVLFVVLGNPSAGGAYQPSLLPPFWRALSGVLPTGAGVDTVRRIVYFDGHNITVHLLVISAWLTGGVTVALIASLRRERGRASVSDGVAR